MLNVTIYESGGGLFGGAVTTETQAGRSFGSGSSSLPPQLVDGAGQISVPYAGRIQASGKTPYEVEQDIAAKLKNKSIDPQAIVTIGTRKGGDLVTVTGDVKQPVMVPVSMSGTRLLDAITAAGGSLGTMYESVVTVIRGDQAKTDRLSDILSNVKKNVALQPGDTVIVRDRPWTYLAFGAIGKTGRFPLTNPDLSLAEALANCAGPNDNRAEPFAYVYRVEPTKLVKALGFTPKDPSKPTTQVIYEVDLNKAQGLFMAQNLSIRDKDIIYFPNADSVAVLKFMNVLNVLTAPARSGMSATSGF
jgi:polysaccharide export outer membrane protein